MLLPLPCSALLCFAYLVQGKAINKGFDGHCSITLKLPLPASFLEVWNNFKIHESGILKKVSITARNAEKSCQMIAKSRGKKITSSHVVCGLNNSLKLLVGDWAQANISHSLAILFICFLFNLCMHNKEKDSTRSQERKELDQMYGGKKKGWVGRMERKTAWKMSNLYVLLQNGVSNISMKDQAYKILLDLYDKERIKSPA